ncbi:hypothetical protein GIB67_014435 [Kingdonia uniflora]|uniref:Neprosin PEP catalytic domain-containing protein n=1 Tax=Kingdonia uniflora TaxID=39325 RepID=A0A7J7LZ11_9MAGN|nr:hypothetical protein GIB67_014435 [Kingdonia uniflora]
MSPTSVPEEMRRGKSLSQNMTSKSGFKSLGCPQGSVPIMRTRKEALRWAKSIPSRTEASALPSEYHFAVTATVGTRKYHGSKTFMAIYNPKVSENQFSGGVTWVRNGPQENHNSIHVGWIADGKGKTGCWDILCSGFVQVSTDITLGLTLEPTSVGEDQYETEFTLFQDTKTGDWWVTISPRETLVGYWPKHLFTSLASHASQIIWGGEVYSPKYEVNTPPMGSGQFVPRNSYKTAYARLIQVMDESYSYIYPEGITIYTYWDPANCYWAKFEDMVWGTMLFGGPGSTCM